MGAFQIPYMDFTSGVTDPAMASMGYNPTGSTVFWSGGSPGVGFPIDVNLPPTLTSVAGPTNPTAPGAPLAPVAPTTPGAPLAPAPAPTGGGTGTIYGLPTPTQAPPSNTAPLPQPVPGQMNSPIVQSGLWPTPLPNPSAPPAPAPVDPIASQFGAIQSIIGNPTGVTPGTGAITPPSATGSPSFTAGPDSSSILRQGVNLVGGQGVDLSNIGNVLLGAGAGALQPPMDFYSALLSGDPTRIVQALAPTANTIAQQYQPAITAARQNLPRGGYAASTEAELPFAEASQIGNEALSLQPFAAQEMTTIADALQKLGITEQGVGQTGIQDIINAALGKMGVTTGITQNLSSVGNFLGALI